jgi:hypothetical protein
MNRRRQRIALCGTLAAVAALSGWLAYELNWKWQRQQARDWLAAQADSWIAPSLEGAKVQATAPWGIRLLGEHAVVAIGMDAEEFKGAVPYTSEVLRRLFPEAEVGVSREGCLVARQESNDSRP